MNKKMIMLGLILSAVTTYSASVDINVTAKLLRPLTMTKSSENVLGEALANTSGTQNLTPITVSFEGGENALIAFSADQTVTLTGGDETLTLTTGIVGGTVTSNGIKIKSDLALSDVGRSELSLGGTIALAGTESSRTYTGTMNIAVDYN